MLSYSHSHSTFFCTSADLETIPGKSDTWVLLFKYCILLECRLTVGGLAASLVALGIQDQPRAHRPHVTDYMRLGVA